MELKALFEDDGAVSPVIGVILMVAIAVILAAVIGTFVLGLGDRVSQAQPTSTFTFEYTQDGGSSDEFTITHDGGDAVTTSQLKITANGKTVWEEGATISPSVVYPTDTWTTKDEISAGDQQTIHEDSSNVFSDGDAVKVIWTASGSDKTAVVGESEVSF